MHKPNIKFSYLYRDAGNYKQYGAVIFSNPDGLLVEEITTSLRAVLIDTEFFEHEKLKVPALFFTDYDYDEDLDHDWHEFAGVSETDEQQNDNRSIKTFLEEFKIHNSNSSNAR